MATGFSVIDDPRFPMTEQNRVEFFNVRWVTPKGKRTGTRRSSLVQAREIACLAKADGCTDIEILRQWFAGVAF